MAIYGDFDVDGVTATAILLEGLRDWASCRFFIPNRFRDGYGGVEALSRLRRSGVGLVVTVDCGVTARSN